MTHDTKMIIITADANIIRQFQLNQTSNVQIVDLDTNLPNNDANLMNMPFLAQLFQSNAKNDQMYKRALDSDRNERSKPAKTRKNSIEMSCAVCGDRAIGYNYDVLTCGSCKSFFGRNANLNLDDIFCFTRQGQCSVSHEVRRKCQKCRLKRCFEVGMRKDFVRSEEENQRRRKITQLKKNVSSGSDSQLNNESTVAEIDELLMNIEDESTVETLSIEELMAIESIRTLYTSKFEHETIDYASLTVSDLNSALLAWSKLANDTILQIIDMIRQIDEFEKLNNDDRFILIKYNISSLFSISKCLRYDFQKHEFDFDNEDQESFFKRIGFYMLCFQPNGFRDVFLNLIRFLAQITEQDPTILSLLLVILLFSQGMSMNENQPLLKDSLAIYRAQSFYLELLWKYMINKQGQMKTRQQFIQIMRGILRIQSITERFLDFFRLHYSTNDSADKLAPLMQSVLHIS